MIKMCMLYLRANMFNHFDTNKSIECLLELGRKLAIIHEVYTDPAFKISFFDAFLRQRLLFLGKGNSIYFTPK